MILVQIYLSFSLFLFYFGPLEYNKVNTPQTVIFVLLFQLALFVGYMLSVYRNQSKVNVNVSTSKLSSAKYSARKKSYKIFLTCCDYY